MSSDNGIFVLASPTADGSGSEYRVAEGSMSFMEEVETHFLSPEQERDALVSMFGGQVFLDPEEAHSDALQCEAAYGYTEYGICQWDLSYPFDTLREPILVPELPEEACKFCSTPGGSVTIHGGGKVCDRDPDNPENIVRIALTNKGYALGVNIHPIARIAVEALRKAGKL
jgi:hypothetical protein